MVGEATDFDEHEIIIQAEPGYALIGFEISDSLDIVAYQAKLNENYEVNAESVSKISVDNSGLGFIGEYYFPIKENYDWVFSDGYVITKIVFRADGSIFTYEVTANFYDPATGNIDDDNKEVKNSSNNTGEYDVCAKTLVPVGLFGDLFLSPLRSFKMEYIQIQPPVQPGGEDAIGKLKFSGESYLREYLIESDLKNKDTVLVYPTQV
jgi:hypothetical protein